MRDSSFMNGNKNRSPRTRHHPTPVPARGVNAGVTICRNIEVRAVHMTDEQSGWAALPEFESLSKWLDSSTAEAGTR